MQSFTFDGTRGSMVLVLQGGFRLQLQKYHLKKRFYEGALESDVTSELSAKCTEILQQASISPSIRIPPDFPTSLHPQAPSVQLSPPYDINVNLLKVSLPSPTFSTPADEMNQVDVEPKRPIKDFMVRSVLRLIVTFVD